MSKAFGLAGLRIGWLSATPTKLTAVARLKDYTTICNSAPSEILAMIALRAKDRILARNLGIVLGNLALVDGFMERHADRFSWVRPTAGATGFPRFLGGGVDRLSEELLRETGVLLLPGSVYGSPSHFRIGFGRGNFPEGLAKFEEWIATRLSF